jgi:hypothetical protein
MENKKNKFLEFGFLETNKALDKTRLLPVDGTYNFLNVKKKECLC